MKRFAIAAALAVALGFGAASTARAQYIIPYGGPYAAVTPNGGIVTGNSIYNLGGYQSYNTYVSPFGTVRQQSFYSNGYSSIGFAQGFNPYTGFGYTRSYYSPAPGLYVVPPTLTPGYRIPTVGTVGGFGYSPYRRW
jgi:hypothetical protein